MTTAEEPGQLGAGKLRRANLILAFSAMAVGVMSYGTTLLMAHLLPVREYTDYAAAQAILTTVGVAAMSLVPLPLSRIVAAHPSGSDTRRSGMAFAITVSALVGLLAAAVLVWCARLFTTPSTAGLIGLSAFALFAIMPVWGWLQGEQRFSAYAVLSGAEVAGRLILSVAAGLLGWGAGGAIAGFAAGAGVVLVLGLAQARRDLVWQPKVLFDRSRWAETGGIALVQLVLSTLVSFDVLLVASVAGDSPKVAGYQAIATLAKGPLYVATGTVLVSFPMLRNAASARRVAVIVRTSVSSFAGLALPAAAVLATLPKTVALWVLPAKYADSLTLLPFLVVAGLGYGLLNVLAVILLALRARRRCLVGLGGGSVLLLVGLVVGWYTGATRGLAIGAMIGSLAAAALIIGAALPLLPGGQLVGRVVRAIVLSALLAGVLALVRPYAVVWVVVAVVVALIVLRSSRRQQGRSDEDGPAGGLRVTHLGFEDPAMPGSGGGSLRTHEINRRLAADGFRVTVLTTRFPGCVDGMRDGVDYRHVGFGSGASRLSRLGGYVLRLPMACRQIGADLVVEDFFAPFSSMAAPLWTGKPTVAMVQWLNAAEKSRQYHLPLGAVERFGVRRHRRLITVSHGVADRITAANPDAAVTVIGNGVDPAAFTVTPGDNGDVVFVGRLEIAQKGLDLLLEAWALTALDSRLVIAGTGPDEKRLRALVAELGITERVRFAGWVSGIEKYELFASARLVVVPSRFETFGIVAAEALASGTPVLAFDIPCLREVIPAEAGRLVPAFDVRAFADELVRTYQDTGWLAGAGQAGRLAARAYDWDALAARQGEVYRSMVRSEISGDPVRAQLADLGRHASRAPRIAIVGNLGNGNTGDEALLASVLQDLDRDATVVVLSRNPAEVTALHGVPARRMTALGAAVVLRGCDALVVIGGGMFGPGLPPLVRALPTVVDLVRWSGRQVTYVGIGVYPGVSRTALGSLRRAAARGEMTVRDDLSVRILDLPDPVPCVGDLAHRLAPASGAEAERVLGEAGVALDRPLLLLSPKGSLKSERTEALIAVLASAARQWTDLGGQVAGLALSARSDRGIPPTMTDAALVGRVAGLAGIPVPVLGPSLRPALTKAVVGQASAVLGYRFHALVFALSEGVPCMGFPWEPKSRTLLAEHDLPTMTSPAGLERWLADTFGTVVTRSGVSCG